MVRLLLFSGWRRCLGLFLVCLVASVQASASECDTSGRKVTCVVRDSTGYVLEIHRFKNDQKSGAWEKFNYDGQVVERIIYRRGQRVWTLYFKDDELIKSINKKGKVKTFSGCGCT